MSCPYAWLCDCLASARSDSESKRDTVRSSGTHRHRTFGPVERMEKTEKCCVFLKASF